MGWIRGILRFCEPFVPRSWVYFFVAEPITDFSKPIVLSAEEIKMMEEKNNPPNLDESET